MKRIFLMMVAALFCVAAAAQNYIETDKTEEGTRYVQTKPCTIITSDYDVLLVSFSLIKNAEQEIYSMALVFFNSSPFSIKKGNGMRINTIEGESIHLYPLLDAWSKPSNGQHIITAMYEIPKNKIRSLICAIQDITTLYTQGVETTQKTYKLPFSSAEELISTYLDFAIYTGN